MGGTWGEGEAGGCRWGAPQWGQVKASVLTAPLHSLHSLNAMLKSSSVEPTNNRHTNG